jgi:acetyltransferase-like isoleucine patch superfamily enzyme
MMGRLLRFLRQPPSRRWQRLGFAWAGMVTRFWHGPRLRSLGRGSIIRKPLFWTPEYIEVGSDVLIWPGCRFEGIDLDPATEGTAPRIILGDGVSFQQHCHLTAARHVEIGARTSVLFGSMITDTDHRYDRIDLPPAQQPLDIRPTVIGEHCFIGARASIQAGTRLGRHCIVGTNAVVRGTFPDHCVLVGAPARVIKRYDPDRSAWRRTDATGAFLPDPN